MKNSFTISVYLCCWLGYWTGRDKLGINKQKVFCLCPSKRIESAYLHATYFIWSIWFVLLVCFIAIPNSKKMHLCFYGFKRLLLSRVLSYSWLLCVQHAR